MYIYESHLGSLYTSDEPIEDEKLYCETCGDSDTLVRYAETREEAWELLKDDCDIDGSRGWNREYIQSFLNQNFSF